MTDLSSSYIHIYVPFPVAMKALFRARAKGPRCIGMLGRHGLFPCLGYVLRACRQYDCVSLDCTHICNTNKKHLLEYSRTMFNLPAYLQYVLNHRGGGSETRISIWNPNIDPFVGMQAESHRIPIISTYLCIIVDTIQPPHYFLGLYHKGLEE